MNLKVISDSSTVLITGHTGFKGAWLSLWLKMLGHKIVGIALPPETEPSLFEEAKIFEILDGHYEVDLSSKSCIPELNSIFKKHKPEIVFHLAAQSIVRRSYKEPLRTWATNLMGAVNLLEAIKACDSVKVAVIVTTDKVYKNKNWVYPYRETDELGGFDPYSASKAACEIAVESYKNAFLKERGIAVATVRAGNVIGGGDWAEDRLIPDAVKAWSKGDVLIVRNPDHVRPWQHVIEPLFGYILLASTLMKKPELSDAYNFGPLPQEVATVREVIEVAKSLWNENAQVIWGSKGNEPKESEKLILDIAKAREALGYEPKWNLAKSIEKTMKWYRDFYHGLNARKLCERDLKEWMDE
ncbi:MAG: CDP-glucose 4,6-dehydratase [Thermodesulfovibrio sp.]|nr:CDP-glucose 4,6-dehydratase [Thermodesulfovibrio sp.]